MTEQENFERIEKLNAELSKSDLPYHTDETEKIAAERVDSLNHAEIESSHDSEPLVENPPE